MSDAPKRDRALDLVSRVDALGDEVKDLALNLALYLAKVRVENTDHRLDQMEPEFIRLVNGAVRVVQELAVILGAARNQETMVYQPNNGMVGKDRIEQKLESVARQCNNILDTLSQSRDINI